MKTTRPRQIGSLARPSRLRWVRSHPIALGAFALAFVCACVDMDDPVFQLPEAIEVPEGEGSHCLSSLNKDPDSMRIHFIDVGQGDSIWIETADDEDDGNGEYEGYQILIDTGEYENAQVIVDYMSRHGLPPGSRIDFLVITHAHTDHYGGAEVIMDNYRVRNIMDPGFDDDSAWAYMNYLTRTAEEIEESGGTFYRPLVGTLVSAVFEQTEIFGSEIETTVLNSSADLRLGDERNNQINNTSIAFSMEFNGISIVLMADVESDVEAEIIAALPTLSANILQVGHHGSTTSSSRDFLELVFDRVTETRRYAVVLSGTRSFGGVTLPHPVVVDRLLDFVYPTHYYATNNGDSPGAAAEGANDDHIQAVIDSDGHISICYVP